MPLWGLGRAHVAPVRVVQLPRLGNLARTINGRVEAPKVGERGGKGQSVQDLRDPGTCLVRLLLVAPVAGGKGVAKAVGDDGVGGFGFEVELLLLVDGNSQLLLELQHRGLACGSGAISPL